MRALDHVSFTVSDRDRAVAFYRTLLGVEPIAVGSDGGDPATRVVGYDPLELRFAYFPLPGSDAVLELFEYVEPPSAVRPLATHHVGNGHLGLVVEDLAAEQARLARAGATFSHHEPVEVRTGAWAGTKAIYMRDPDGITIELMESPPPLERRFAAPARHG